IFALELETREQAGIARGNTLKAHYLLHFVDELKKISSGLEADTVDNEHDHIENVKRMVSCSRKGRDVATSVIRRRLELDCCKSVIRFLNSSSSQTITSVDKCKRKQIGSIFTGFNQATQAILAPNQWIRNS